MPLRIIETFERETLACHLEAAHALLYRGAPLKPLELAGSEALDRALWALACSARDDDGLHWYRVRGGKIIRSVWISDRARMDESRDAAAALRLQVGDELYVHHDHSCAPGCWPEEGEAESAERNATVFRLWQTGFFKGYKIV